MLNATPVDLINSPYNSHNKIGPLTENQFDILDAINLEGEVNLLEVARILGCLEVSAERMMGGFMKKGIIEKSCVTEPGRIPCYKAAPLGIEAYGIAMREIEGVRTCV